jgi:eukaryotic-like serine/threonine-protein kinase
VGETGAGCLDEDDVLAFVAGDLSAERRAALMAHLDECEACRSLIAALAHDGSPDSRAVAPGTPSAQRMIDGRFRLEGPLGRGAMGTVFRAFDERLGAEIALKLMKREGDPKSFARELHAARRVTHPNVCRVHDAGSIDGYDYITMELIEGEVLAALITREDLSRRRACEVIDGIAAGLAEAHAQGIVHRDLKPANVMIERNTGRVVLTDFGVATDLAGGASYRLVGTPQYWPPEQARGEPASPASDVYSLGVVAYRVLTGRDLRLSEEHPLAEVPRAFRGVIERCLEHRPSERYKDAAVARAAFASAARASQRFIGGRTLVALAVLAAVGAVAYGLASASGGSARPDASASPVSGPLSAAHSAAAAPVTVTTALTAASAPAPAAVATIAAPEVVAPAPSSTQASSPPRPAATRSPRPVRSASAQPAASASTKGVEGDILYVK